MAKTFQLSVVSPDRSVVDEPVVSVIAPGSEGYFGVLAGHVPFVAALRPGLLEYETQDHKREFVAVQGGFFEMTGEKATVLADAAEKAGEVNVNRAETDLEEARKALRGEDSKFTREEAAIVLEHAINRLKVAQKAQ